MPNKSVAGYTQVPVQGGDVLSVHYDRTPSNTMSLLALYEIKDNGGVVRGVHQIVQTGLAVGAFLTGVALLAACNTAEGT